MNYIVDTHLLIWSVLRSACLSPQARCLLSETASRYFFSAASIWEIGIKHSKKPDDIPLAAEEARELFVEAGFEELPVAARHAVVVETLPPVHGDPFDRILVAQAMTEGCTLLTHDHLMSPYGNFVITV